MQRSNLILGHEETRGELIGVCLLRVLAADRSSAAKGNPSMLERIIASSQEMRNLVCFRESLSPFTVRGVDQDNRIAVRLLEEKTIGLIVEVRVLDHDTCDASDPSWVNRKHATPSLAKKPTRVAARLLSNLGSHHSWFLGTGQACHLGRTVLTGWRSAQLA
jgi:hypothetical protein